MPLEDMADALDILSLVCALRGGADLDNECLREPLHTFLSPMSDSCLEIDYIVLDPNVITRCNPSRLPDNLGAELQTGAGIDTYLRSAASQRIHALPGYDAACGTLALSLLPQRGGQPMGPSILEVDCNVTLANVRDAMSFVGIVSQQSTPGGVVDTVAYLSTMVRWDWIHQGKLQAPSSAGTASGAAGDEHTYRVGVRRTRQRTYRAHVKFMPPSMQQFLISWNAFK
ncbi:hypothetical protein LPJ70_002550 [Coemansia sp. RSA 2708]|nr:hypothetical protein LPJ70_002550 [Coemansia sp. RSA 2708]